MPTYQYSNNEYHYLSDIPDAFNYTFHDGVEETYSTLEDVFTRVQQDSSMLGSKGYQVLDIERIETVKKHLENKGYYQLPSIIRKGIFYRLTIRLTKTE
ncbi:hypothetical protein MUN82_10295 [Hymenobacter aerilatus]|uniref:Uncharacterized protein n=1 Tax=Hymenobacter aerilatus TaxID=2932251 RepID=A0A8T9T0U8_9BACT|nr:hypothetical protein [Hymenobacter aerilatus]UOR07467.1 hypothetical protein MUN82_10295 [Hymenobacter aerilatus]